MKFMNLLCILALFVLSPMVMAEGKSKYSPVNKDNSVILNFKKGSDSLSVQEMEKLRRLIVNAETMGKISRAEVAVWSDKDHPAKGNLSKADRELANNRIKTVKAAIKKDVAGLTPVETYNMAERAHWLGRTFNTEEAELDAVFAKKETGAMDREDFVFIKEEGAPSKAVVILKVKREGNGNGRSNGMKNGTKRNGAGTTTYP